MSQRKLDLFAPIDWQTKLFGSPRRCHIIGGSLSLLLMVAVTWSYLHPQSMTSEGEFSREQIDEAIQLISQSDLWRQRETDAKTERDDLDARVNVIKNWLPQEQKWNPVRAFLLKTATDKQLHVLSLRRDQEFTGSRVAVLKVILEVHGRYENVCHLLHTLSTQQQPFWCDEIDLVRDKQNSGVDPTAPRELSDDAVECSATISIRVPFVGQQTAAEKLIGAPTQPGVNLNAT
ncbi:hypothetical protein [Stieleria varia]|uniref:Uncharacterized protein n=1 Tax=Stieleria varia TaxID=2528005 RepID=A0A5C6A3Q8_9BACT|nr:hypothetical protein [Stieleria varia]TWT93977.1 hypothetical protein Pla52n_58060 [Stieleria varia]